MRINWKRFSLGAFLLASLSLLLLGCGDTGSSNTVASSANSANKPISGFVSNPDTGFALKGATVTAYAMIDGRKSTALSVESTVSDQKGAYVLYIPSSYGGSVLIEAVPSSVAKLIAKLTLKSANSAIAAPNGAIRSVVPQALIRQAVIPPVMVSFATEAVVQFVESNSATVGFTATSIKQAEHALETFFPPNSAQIPPPVSASDSSTTRQQQDLIVSIRALSAVITNTTVNTSMVDLVQRLYTGGLQTVIADAIKTEIAKVAADPVMQVTLPPEYAPSAAVDVAISNVQFAAVVKITEAVLTDATPPSAPANLVATAASAKRVNLSWSSSTDAGQGATGVAGYTVSRADSSKIYVTIGTVSAQTTSFSDLAAAGQTAYSYKVAAYDAARNFSEASSANATTPRAVDSIPPSAPTGLAAIGFDATQVNLQWSQSTKTSADGTVLPAAGYNVYRNSLLIATTSETTFVDKTVQAGSDYIYYLKAFDADSNLSVASQTLTIQIKQPVSTAVAAPTDLQAPTVSHNKVTLTWTAGSGVTYNVYRDGTRVATGLAGATYSDAGVAPLTAYNYKVTASAASGESAAASLSGVTTLASPTVTDTSAPSTPSNLVAISVTSSSVSLTWSASTKTEGDKLVAGYDVFRGDGAGANMVKIATVAKPGYTDATVSAATAYSYQVKSVSTAGYRSAASAAWLIPRTPAAANLSDVTPPSVPVLNEPTRASGKITLSWTASTKITGDLLVAGYLVYRNGAQIAEVNASILTYTDATVAPSTAYSYTIKAFDNSGNRSAASEAKTVETLAAAPDTYTVYGKVTLNGSGLADIVVSIGSSSVVTDANGNYSFTEMPKASYTLTAATTGYYQFTPATRSITVSSGNVTGQDFVGVLSGSLNAGVTYPNGTIIGGISYPSGTVIGGVTYPTSTVIGGVIYPTGTVIGGISYPNGVVIGGVSYPSGTVVGGIAFPVGAVTTGVSYPSGTVIGGVVYPSGTVTGGVIYPSGTVIGALIHPSGAVIGGVFYPTGAIVGGLVYPAGAVFGGVTYPAGTVLGGATYPTSALTGQSIFYPTGVISGGAIYPTGGASGGATYPSGGASGGVTYPVGTVTGSLLWPTP